MLKQSSNKPIYIISLLVFLLAFSVNLVRYELKQAQNYEALEKHFALQADNYFSSIEQAVKVEIERLNALAAAFKIQGALDENQFDAYAQVITASKNSIQALAWLPMVTSSERAQFEASLRQRKTLHTSIMLKTYQGLKVSPNQPWYLPVKYIYPLQGNEAAIGLDVNAVTIEKRALDAAKNLNKPVITAPVRIVQETATQKAALIYQPIFTDSQPKTLKGYVGLVLRMQDFFDFVKADHFLNSALSYSIADISADVVAKPAFFVNEPLDSSIPEAFYKEAFHTFTIGERTWSLAIKGDVRNLSGYQTFMIKGNPILGGTLISFMAAFLIFGLLSYRRDHLLNKAALQVEKNRFESFLEYNTDAFFMTQKNGKIVSVNDQATRLTGYSREQLLTMNLTDVEKGHSRKELLNIYRKLDFKQRVLIESICLRKDRLELPIEINSTKFLIDGEVMIGSFVRDMTEQVRFKALSEDNIALEEALQNYTQQLKEQKNAFETVFEKSADGILIASGRRIIDCNEATLQKFGYASKAEVLKQPNSLFAPKFQPDGSKSVSKGNQMLLKCLKQGSHNFEWVNRKSSGELFWSDVVLTRLNLNGEIRVHIAFRDISQRKKLEADLMKAKERAEQASLAKSDFLASMSHEIRTPLHGILSYSNLGIDRLESVNKAKLARYFELINTSGQRLMLLLNDLLDSAKLENRSMQFEFAIRDIKVVLEQAISEQASVLDNKKIELISPNHSQTAYFDAIRIRQVFANLISNAIKFSQEGSQIVIEYALQPNDTVLISVRDFGTGIHQDALLIIFDKFTQSHVEHDSIPGTGLGLAICKEIIEAHNGSIWAENAESRGAIFKFTLPLNMPIAPSKNLPETDPIKNKSGDDI